MIEGFLATKFSSPVPPRKRLYRPRLTNRLQEGLRRGCRVGLVSAPAGFGKTTCVRDWADSVANRRVGWLSLDPLDDEPRRFFPYFIEALNRMDPTVGHGFRAALQDGDPPAGDALITAIVNDLLAAGSDFLLVLDDFHVIQNLAILRFFEGLIAGLPDCLHLVLVTREDPPLPLARLRAHKLLTEIRAQDLQLDRAETRQFLAEVLELDLSAEDTKVLDDRTEGWVVGLQLAGLSISDRENAPRLIARLSGGHRFITDYLTEEVLNRQPESMQEFLLATCLLGRLCAGLCNAVTGRTDGQTYLERLFDANVFLVSLDETRRWYRYHHLFRESMVQLRRMRPSTDEAELNRRASAWYAAQGMADEAIRHALAAGDYSGAAALVEEHAPRMAMDGYAGTVTGWLEATPAEFQPTNPETLLALAWAGLLRGAYAEATGLLERVERRAADQAWRPDPAGRRSAVEAEVLTMRSLLQYRRGEIQLCIADAECARELVPSDDRVEALLHYALASGYRADRRKREALREYRRAVAHSRRAASPVAEALSTIGLALMEFQAGRLSVAYELAWRILPKADSSPPPISSVAYGLLGEVHYQRCALQEARKQFERAVTLSSLGGFATAGAASRVLLSRVLLLEGDVEAAESQAHRAGELIDESAPAYMRHDLAAQLVAIRLAQVRPEAAETLLRRHGLLLSAGGDLTASSALEDAPDQSSFGVLYNGALRVLLRRGAALPTNAFLERAVKAADRAVDKASEDWGMPETMNALLLRAQMKSILGGRRGHQGAGQDDYLQALEFGAPEDIVAPFVEQGPHIARDVARLLIDDRLGDSDRPYLERILSQLPPAPGPADSPADVLTGREQDVLRLIAAGLTYREVAAELYLSLNTVRFHVKAIYAKLNANNRTKAVEKAQRLGLL